MAIYYLAPDNDRPSWGVGIIYHHVAILKSLGMSVYLVHNQEGFSLNWLQLDIPIRYFSNVEFSAKDILVVPEVMVADHDYRKIPSKKILFIQAVSLLFHNFNLNLSHKSQGFSEAFIILPHQRYPVEKYTRLPTTLIPPFVADYFFTSKKKLHNREKIVLFYPKYQQFEYSFIKHLVCRECNLQPNIFTRRILKHQWRFIELSGFSHEEVADLMKKSTFFISTNTFEAFNTSVPEAMAAGCINICYEAFGPRDFLVDGRNAFAFPNNEAVALSERVIELINDYPANKKSLEQVRSEGWKTAEHYRRESMTKAIVTYYSRFNTR